MTETTARASELESRWRAASGRERSVLQARLAWFLHGSDPARSERLAREALEQLGETVGVEPTLPCAPDAAPALLVLGASAIEGADLEGGTSLFRRALAAFQASGDVPFQAAAQNCLANSWQASGRYADALESARLAAELASAAGEAGTRLVALNSMGNAALGLGDAGAAAKHYEQCLAGAREIGRTRFEIAALGNLGRVYRREHRWTEALQALHRALDLAEQQRDRHRTWQMLDNLSVTYLNLGQPVRAGAFAERALGIVREMDHQRGEANCLRSLAAARARQGQPDEAVELSRSALAIYTALGALGGIASTHGVLGRLLGHAGESGNALEHLDAAEATLGTTGDLSGMAEVYLTRARIHEPAGRLEQALSCYREANRLAHDIHRASEEAAALVGMGRVLRAAGRPQESMDALVEARRLARPLELPSPITPVHLELAETLAALGRFDEAYDELSAYHEVEREIAQRVSRQESDHLRAVLHVDHAQREATTEREKNLALAETNEALQTADRDKNELLQIIAHDLRNPLAAIALNADFVLQFADDTTPTEVVERQEAILQAADRMQSLIDPLMDVGAIDSGTFDSAPNAVDLGRIAERLATAHRDAAERKQIRVTVEQAPGTPLAWAHPDGSFKVIDNLLGNALKFSPERSSVAIRIGPLNGSVVLEVADQGPGIPPEEQPLLFEKFTRLSPRPTGGESSSGLGLYIVRKLADQMGGTVTCESAVGSGACFRVVLPAADTADRSTSGSVMARPGTWEGE